MKLILSLLIFFNSASALANNFDQFIGEYSIVGTIQVTAKNTKTCDRFGLAKLAGVKVEANTTGYQQSHVIYFVKPNGWSGHPVSEYLYRNEFDGSIGSFSKVAGGAGSASASNGNFDRYSEESLTVTLVSNAQGAELNVIEQALEKSNVVFSCEYRAQLTKK